MTTLFRFFMLLFVTSFTCSTFAQNNANVSYDGRKLIGKKWHYSDTVNGIKETRTMVFDKDSVKEIIVRGDKTKIHRHAYYLDDYLSIDFYPEKIGYSTRGKYLYRGAGDMSFRVIIHKLTDDEFIYSFYKNSPLIKFTAIKEK